MSDTSGGGFGKFVPGFEFLQNLAGQAAGGIGQGISNNIPQLPNLSSWVAPTVNVEDLEKRIEELKAVHFWLDQNSKALGATIQALEVQKMTLATLQTMNFSFGDVANALKIKAQDSLAGLAGGGQAAAPPTQFAGLEVPPRTYGTAAAAPAVAAAPKPAKARVPAARKKTAKAAAPAGGVVDPVQWWGALSNQFQNIAANAMKDVAKQSALDTTRQVASGLTGHAVKAATGVAGKVARNVGQAAAAGKAVAGRTGKTVAKAATRSPGAARKKSSAVSGGGEWPMPSAFFPAAAGFLAPAAPEKRARKTPVKSAAASATAAKKAAKKTASKRGAAKAPARARRSAATPSARRR